MADVMELNLLLERREGEILDHAFQLGEVPRPRIVAQRVQRGDREAPRRAKPRLDQLRQHERREVRHVLGEFAHGRQFESQLRKAHAQIRIERVLLDERARIDRRKRDDARLVLVGPGQQEFQMALLGALEAAEIGKEEHAARGFGEQVRGRFGKHFRTGDERRAGGHQ